MAELIEERSKTISKKNRSSFYPFSFIAPFLYFISENTNQYFTTIEEIFNANNPEEALLNWKAFLSSPGPQWSNIPTWLFELLDKIYSSMVLDKYSPMINRKTMHCFWLALLALSVTRYDKMIAYLNMGNVRSNCHHKPKFNNKRLKTGQRTV